MMKKKVYEKIVNIDLDIHKKATSDEFERYDAALSIISYQLFNAPLPIKTEMRL